MTDDTKTLILDAYLELMRDLPLRDVSMQHVAAAAGCTLAEVRRAYPTETDLFFGYAEMVDLAVLAQSGEITGTARERVYRAPRLRIEYLVPLRHAIVALIDAAKADPALRETFHAISTVEQMWMLIAAGLRFGGPAAGAGVEGLIGSFAATVGGWLSQDDPNAAMQAALAGLNGALDQGEDWLTGLKSTPSRARPDPTGDQTMKACYTSLSARLGKPLSPPATSFPLQWRTATACARRLHHR